MAFIASSLSFASPFFLNRILTYLSISHNDSSSDSSNESKYTALLNVIAILVCQLIRSITDGQTYFIGRRIGVRVRNIVMGKMYGRAVGGGGSVTKNGEVVNMMVYNWILTFLFIFFYFFVHFRFLI